MKNPICELLYEVLIATHRGAVKDVARVAGLAERTVYDHCTDGRLNPSVEVIKAAFVVTGDPRLRRLLTPRGWRLVPDQAQVEPERDAEGELTDVTLAAGDAIKALRDALDPASPGGRGITKDEAREIDCCLAEVERQLAEARAAIAKLKNQRPRPMAVAKK